VPKVHIKPIKRPKNDSNIESKSQPKCPLVWRTGLSGVPSDSVWCTRDSNSELLTFGNSGSHSAIIHRTVRWRTGLSGVLAEQRLLPRQRSSAEGIKCATVRARVRAKPDGAPDNEQRLSGAPPDCPVAQKIEAPTVEIQRFGDVAGAPDCPVRHTTAAFTKRLVWWLGL
jgi:hypothetical protein